MKTLVFSNRKGGVGKSISCFAVATGLSSRIAPGIGKKYRVLTIDMDSQANLNQCFGVDYKKVNSSYHLLAKEKGIKDVILSTSLGPDFIPGSPALDAAKLFTSLNKYFLLRDALRPIADQYDYCCIDTSCDIINNTATICSLVMADKVIVPLEVDPFAISGINELTYCINDIKAIFNPGLEIAGLLITRYEGSSNINKEIRNIIKEMATALGSPAFDTLIRKNITLKEAAAVHESIFEYSPKSNGAKDYNSFIDELFEKGVI